MQRHRLLALAPLLVFVTTLGASLAAAAWTLAPCAPLERAASVEASCCAGSDAPARRPQAPALPCGSIAPLLCCDERYLPDAGKNLPEPRRTLHPLAVHAYAAADCAVVAPGGSSPAAAWLRRPRPSPLPLPLRL